MHMKLPRQLTAIQIAIASILIALYAYPTRANAQKVYQCGSTISQTPCVGGAERDLTDGRSQDQRKQSEKATNSVAKTADAMEKSRLSQEKQDAATHRGTVITAQPTPSDTPPPAGPKVLKKKKRQAPEHFTAQAPVEKKEKKKSRAKKATGAAS